VSLRGLEQFFRRNWMTWLLVRVSGVAMLEKALVDSKPGYREYAQNTSAFIPWFPRRLSEKP
jgi:steroid 5-alpha reductase family enzyme